MGFSRFLAWRKGCTIIVSHSYNHKDILFPSASGNITAVYSIQTAENIHPGIKSEKDKWWRKQKKRDDYGTTIGRVHKRLITTYRSKVWIFALLVRVCNCSNGYYLDVFQRLQINT